MSSQTLQHTIPFPFNSIFPSRLLHTNIPYSIAYQDFSVQVLKTLTALRSMSIRLRLVLRGSRLKHQYRLIQLSSMWTVDPDVLRPLSLLRFNGDGSPMIKVIFRLRSRDGEGLDVVLRLIGRTLGRSRSRGLHAAVLTLLLRFVSVFFNRLTHGFLVLVVMK